MLYNQKQSPSGSLGTVVGRGPETASESSERVSQSEASLYVGQAYDLSLATTSQLAKKILGFSEEFVSEVSLYVEQAYDQYLATASQLAKLILDFAEEFVYVLTLGTLCEGTHGRPNCRC